jgi:hypothetical protein
MNTLKPNPAEQAILDLAYNRFIDLFDEVMDDSYWSQDAYHRF